MRVLKSHHLAIAGLLVLAMPVQAVTAAVRPSAAIPTAAMAVSAPQDEEAVARAGFAWPAIGVIIATIVAAIIIERHNAAGAVPDSVANLVRSNANGGAVHMKRGPAVFLSGPRTDGDTLPIGGMLLLVVAVILGGGHIEGPIRNGLIQSSAAALLLALAWKQWRNDFLPTSATIPLILWLAILGLFLFFLLPLPPALAPGGREMTDAVRGLVGVPVRWRPLSLDPTATIRMAASLLVPIAMTFATLSAGTRGRIFFLRTLLALATASAALGVAQLALGYPAWATPFGKSDPGVADGLFVNRNHQSMFMLSGLIATGVLIRLEEGSRSVVRIALGRRRMHLAWLLMPVLTVMTVASASRAGIALLCIVLPGSIMLAIGGGRRGHSARFPRWIAALLVALLVGALAFALLPSESIATLRSRMVFSGGTRVDVLPDLMSVVGQYWPWGSGPGTFVPVFKGIEDLDKLAPAISTMLITNIWNGRPKRVWSASSFSSPHWRRCSLASGSSWVPRGPTTAKRLHWAARQSWHSSRHIARSIIRCEPMRTPQFSVWR